LSDRAQDEAFEARVKTTRKLLASVFNRELGADPSQMSDDDAPDPMQEIFGAMVSAVAEVLEVRLAEIAAGKAE
jgi:hypothetical protein